jgi:AcrR family transcriptional regulator
MPTAKQRTPELRDHVLNSAIELLAGAGVARLTTRAVARQAATSPPAIYELFGHKAGLVREIFLDGFRRLQLAFDEIPRSRDPLADASALIQGFRRFARLHPRLVEVMFARPFADFLPGPQELRAGVAVHDAIIESVQRCIDAGLIEGDPTDVAHAIMALAQGLAAAENAGRLGSSAASVERRWELAIHGLLQGLRPNDRA